MILPLMKFLKVLQLMLKISGIKPVYHALPKNTKNKLKKSIYIMRNNKISSNLSKVIQMTQRM